jgi:hypothetical protein
MIFFPMSSTARLEALGAYCRQSAMAFLILQYALNQSRWNLVGCGFRETGEDDSRP